MSAIHSRWSLIADFLLALLKLIPVIWDVYRADPKRFKSASEEVFSYARTAKGSDEKSLAAKRIQDLISRLR